MTEFDRTDLNRISRLPKRGHYDRETVYGILDEALICHVAFVEDGQPYVIPTLHARSGDDLLLHGASTSRMLLHAAAGHPLSIGVTLVDGIVLARSIFHHSINYRSVVLFGQGGLVEEPEAKLAALAAFSERLLPGRWADSRQPNPVEMKATAVIRIPIEMASAKVRVGPPGDDEEDVALPHWAGVLPLRQAVGEPLPAPNLAEGIALPDYLQAFMAEHR